MVLHNHHINTTPLLFIYIDVYPLRADVTSGEKTHLMDQSVAADEMNVAASDERKRLTRPCLQM